MKDFSPSGGIRVGDLVNRMTVGFTDGYFHDSSSLVCLMLLEYKNKSPINRTKRNVKMIYGIFANREISYACRKGFRLGFASVKRAEEKRPAPGRCELDGNNVYASA